MSKDSNKHRIYPYFNKGRFYNHSGEKKPPFLLPSLGMLIEWYFCKSHEKKVDISNWINKENPIAKSDDLAITWIGHSTFLIQIGGINILTDPIFGNLSPLFPRILPVGIELKDLPNIDFVILSHNHRDHMDNTALKTLKNHKDNKILVPLGDKKWFDKRSFNNVSEYMWWDNQKFVKQFSFTANSNSNFSANSTEIEFTFLPSYHWSQRGIFDYNKSLWGSWMIKCKDTTIYFAGDTAYSSHFKSIAQEFEKIDIALMPIAPCEPRQWMKWTHINPEEAVQGFIDLNAKHFIPMHWGTYYFGVDNFHLPYNRLVSCWNKNNLSKNHNLHIFKAGQRQNINPAQLIIDPFQDQTSIIQSETKL